MRRILVIVGGALSVAIGAYVLRPEPQLTEAPVVRVRVGHRPLDTSVAATAEPAEESLKPFKPARAPEDFW